MYYESLDRAVKTEARETRQNMEWKFASIEESMEESNAANAEMRVQIENSNVDLRNKMKVLLERFLTSNDRIDPETHNSTW